MSKDSKDETRSTSSISKLENRPDKCESISLSECSNTKTFNTDTNLDGGSSNSTVSIKSENKHYISKIEPDFASCSLSPLDSDKILEFEYNEEYYTTLMKEIRNDYTESHEEKLESVNFSKQNKFEDIPLTNFSKLDDDKLKYDEKSINLIPKEIRNSPNTKLSGPRLTNSDSYISMKRIQYFHENERRPIFPLEVDIDVWKKTAKTDTVQVSIQNKSNPDNEQSSSSTPVSMFENDRYKSFTDSNSHDDDALDSLRLLNGRKKSTTGKVEFKKGIELKNSSLLSVPSTVCRICHTNTVNERLLSPCYCKGSLAYVHLSCLERWLNQSSRSYCELCLYQYNAVETLRYGFFEGIRLWIRHPRNRNHVKSDCLIAFLLTLITFGLLVICFIGMDYFMIEGIKLGMSKMWTKSFIVSFLGVIMMGYCVTIYLIAKDQFVPWYTWWKNTLNIRLLLSPTVTQT